jgi:hypothetical protein
VNHRSDDGTGSSSTDQGFQNTATRINLRGLVYGDYAYWVRVNADTFGRDPLIDAAMLIWFIKDDMNLVMGQFPNLLTREQGMPLEKLLFAESSPTNFAFDAFAYKGVMLGYHTPKLVFRGIVNDGYRSLSNSFFEQPSADFAFAGQVVWMTAGDEDDWDRFNNFTSRRGSDFAWQISGGFHVQGGASNLEPAGGESPDLFLGIVESSMEGDGWNLYGSGYYRNTDPSANGIVAQDYGFVVQGGGWVSEHFEAYSRFDMTIPDRDRPTERDDFKTIAGGFAYYPVPSTDNIKINTELHYFFDAEAGSIVAPNVNPSVRSSPAGDQWVARIQFTVRW